jgi:hypothetical protein
MNVIISVMIFSSLPEISVSDCIKIDLIRSLSMRETIKNKREF